MIGPEVLSSTGGIQVAGNVMLSWSLGETMIITVSDGNNSLTQGFQQSGQTFFLLPVELLDFSGKQVHDQIYLDWETAFEQENALFTIEKSEDLYAWNSIGELPGAGTTHQILTYDFIDSQPYNGLNYYRLRQVDFNGTETYSEIIAVHFKKHDEFINLYPNPVYQGNMTIEVPNSEEVQSIELYDLMGRFIPLKISSLSKITTLNLAQVSAGKYYLRIRLEKKIIHKEILIIR